MLYFAYASNMNWEQMQARCSSAQFVCVAKLGDHRLAFTRRSRRRGCGTADAVASPGEIVWGVVYEIEEHEIDRLDEMEDFVPGRAENGYTREQRYVRTEGEYRPMRVSLYFATKEPNPPAPSAEYRRLIVEGGRHWGLPDEYIDQLGQVKVGD